jgi:hypothetical protein
MKISNVRYAGNKTHFLIGNTSWCFLVRCILTIVVAVKITSYSYSHGPMCKTKMALGQRHEMAMHVSALENPISLLNLIRIIKDFF